MTSPGGTLTQRLQLVVDATTDKAETRFRTLTGAAEETGEATQRAAASVRDAANRVAAAQDRQLTAAGNLRVAQERLDRLRSTGRATADQLASAEERVATAQRGLHMATRSTEQALEDQTAAQQRAATQMDDTGGQGGRLSGVFEDLKGKAVGAAVALGGAGLLGMLRGLGEGFATGARDAGQLATSMNATVEEAGAFLGLVGTLGLDLNDLLEIQAEFATKTKDGLTLVGTELQRNDDGTVNWANTLVDALAELQKIPDATERNRQGFAMFGEEGYKQLSRLVSSGVDVRDALAQIGTPLTQEDVRLAAEYDAAMMDLSLASTRAQQSLGRVLLPVLGGIAEGIGDVAAVVEDIPLPLAVATAAAVALGITGFTPTAVAGARLTAVKAALTRQMALYAAAAGTGTRATFLLTGAMSGASAAGSGLLGAVGGPLGVALLTLGAAWSVASGGVDAFRASAREAAEELAETEDATGDAEQTVAELGRRLAEEAGFWERYAASAAGARDVLEDTGAVDPGGFLALGDMFGDGDLAASGFADEVEAAAEELGAFGVQGQTTQRTQRALNDLIAEGTTTGSEFAGAVREAAEAQAAETRTSDLAEAALDAYNAVTRDAVQSQLDMYNATLAQSDSLIGLQQTVHEAAGVVDDLATPWNEVDEATNRVIGSALSYAETAADSAVASGRATGAIVDALSEAQIRGDATVTALRDSLNAPGLTDAARGQITDMIGDLEAAQEAGDVEAILRLTGVEETTGELDDATGDRDTRVNVESRGGPAVVAYLDRITADRLTRIRVESRNGPAVATYLDSLTAQRLALIRVESRNGPAVDDYLDGLASQRRVAYIDVEERGAGAGRGGPFGAPTLRGAPGATAGMYGAAGVSVGQMTVVVQADAGGRLTQPSLAEAGRQVARQLAAHERTSGTGWRTRGRG